MTLNGIDGNGGTVQVSAYGSNAICHVMDWTASANVAVEVQCVDPVTLIGTNASYTLLFVSRLTGSPRVAYAWANQPTVASYTPNPTYSYNPGGTVTVTRSAIGSYQVTFAGIEAAIADAGNVQVTPYGTSSRCVTGGWGSNGLGSLVVDVRCYAGGGPNDTRFTVLFTEAGGAAASGTTAYAWANELATGSYTPSSDYSHVTDGGTVLAQRQGVGQYGLTFGGIASAADQGTVQVTAYNSDAYCATSTWGPNGTALSVSLRCYAGNGSPVDVQYTLLYVSPDRTGTASETVPDADGIALAVAGPNPSRDGTEVAVTLAKAATARVRVLDALGREVARLHDGPLTVGTTALSWYADAVQAGTYHVQLEVGTVVRVVPVTVVR